MELRFDVDEGDSGHCRYIIDIDHKDMQKVGPPPHLTSGEFNPHGGISIDMVDGGWPQETTIDLPAESLSMALLRLAFYVASIEQTNIDRAKV